MKREKWWRRSRVCLRDKVAAWQLDSRTQRLRLCRAIKSRTRATKSRDKIARVTSVLGGMLWLHGALCVRVRVMFEASGRRHLGRASR